MTHEFFAADQYRMLHVSDLHFGTEQAAVVAALMRWVREQRPSGVVITGDITQRATPAQFAAARAFVDELAALGVPLLGCLPGNHDIPLFALWQRLVTPYQRFARVFDAAVVGPDGMSSHEDEGLLLICVKTTRRWRHERGTISSAQAQAVAERLRASTTQQLRVVAVHQPIAVKPGASDADQVLRGADAALAQWNAAGCDVVLGGHIHLPYVLRLPGARAVWLAQAGTAVSRRTRAGVPNSFGELIWHQSLRAAAMEGTTTFGETTPGPLAGADSGFLHRQASGRSCLWQQWDFDAQQQAFVLAKRGRLGLSD